MFKIFLRILRFFFKLFLFKKTSKKVHADKELLNAKVIRVIDGDTVEVLMNSNKKVIRLYGIDCPEDGQEWGAIARAGLIKMIGGKDILIECYGEDSYNRILGVIYIDDEKGKSNVNEKMISKGHAWVMRRFYKDLPKNRQNNLNRLESWAKKKKVGLWKTENPIAPWKYRNEKEK